MTSGGKVRIYELSRDLGLDNRDVLNAAEKLSIAAKSHSSSISDGEAAKIKALLNGNGKAAGGAKAPAKPEAGNQILSLKKAPSTPSQSAAAPPSAPPSRKPEIVAKPAAKPASPAKPAPSAPPSRKPEVVAKPAPKPASPAKPAPSAPPSRKPEVVAKPAPKPTPARPAQPLRPQASNRPPQQPPSRPQAKPAAKPPVVMSKPTAPPPRPAKPAAPVPRRDQNRPPVPMRPPNQQQRPSPQRSGPPRSGAPIRPGAPQRPGMPGRSGAPQQRRGPGGPGGGRPPSSLELVGKPIRREPNAPQGRQGGGPSRPGGPGGMRKPVSPGELMQLQKPGSRPTPGDGPRRPPARPGSGTDAPRRPGEAPNRPNAPTAPPRRPGYRPAAAPGMAGRPRRPDWDDSARLDALRSRSPQKQRQKVHIIGENDDSLAAQTGGFAGGQEALVLQASLARPSKPKNLPGNKGARPVALRRRKKETTRQRQRRRAMELRQAREAKQIRPEMLVVPEGNLTVQELADKLSVESSEIIKSLFFKGIIATVTQTLDLESIEKVSQEFGVPVLQDDIEEAAKKTVEMIEESDLDHLIRRPPVVTVMGHVDHGKTSLLDAIRKTRVAAGEAGGITQHIGAYQVDVDHAGASKKVTFLDTPGHEAFTAMRARGTKVTDVAILVVAADDGVRPQTLEAISHARAAEVPIVVAINKVDKEGAQIDRVKQELSEQSLLAEDWGGDTVMVPVSALKGEGLDKLLEMILLVTEVEDLKANPERMAKGTVVEAHLDKAKGPVATLLVQNGTLRPGDVVAAGPVLGKVRAMVNDSGRRVKEAAPSSAVEVLGFSEVPAAGDEFEVYPDEKAARSVVGDRASEARATRLAQQMASRRVSLTSMSGQASEGELKELNLILKADVQGSVEAILGMLEQLPQGEVQVRVLLSAPGEVTETDVDLAAASGAVIVGFNTTLASGARRAAELAGVDVRDYDVIYKLLEDIQAAMEGLLEPELVESPLGEAEVRAVFSIGKSAVAGCYVTSGSIQRNCKIRIHRGKEVVFSGDLDSLKRMKNDVKEVNTGFECGMGCDRFADWQEGDRVEAFAMVTQRRTLAT